MKPGAELSEIAGSYSLGTPTWERKLRRTLVVSKARSTAMKTCHGATGTRAGWLVSPGNLPGSSRVANLTSEALCQLASRIDRSLTPFGQRKRFYQRTVQLTTSTTNRQTVGEKPSTLT
jgi:hypothetical protein